MILVSLDPNTKQTGVVWWADGYPSEWYTIKAKSRDAMVRQIVEPFGLYKPDALAIEGVYVGQNYATALSLARLVGALEGWAIVNGVACYVLTTGEIDAACGIRIDRSPYADRKSQTLALARRELGDDITEHEADAYCCGVAGRGKLKQAAYEAAGG